ncbi:MAG: hypothetical protein H6732_17065 [Alphaproteobacteria bacterium]|nr:hypothetical protein [Alphaproteobacteria bacterium]
MTFGFPRAATKVEVRPRALLEARRRAEAFAASRVDAAPEGLDALARRLATEGTRLDPSRLARREVRGCVYLISDRSVGPLALRVLISEASRLTDRQLATLVAFRPDEWRALAAVRARAERRSLRGPLWFASAPQSAWHDVVDLTRTLSISPSARDASLPGLFDALELDPATPLAERVGESWLSVVDRRALRRHLEAHEAFVKRPEAPAGLVRALADATLDEVAMGAAGPGQLPPAAPGTRMLHALRERYDGWPREALQQRRWQAHARRTLELARWLWISESIETFFGRLRGDRDRLVYWRRWISHITDTEHFREANAFMVQVGRLCVVEFGDVGNAAYAYDERAWPQVRARRPRRPEELKHKGLAMFRIIHNAGWQRNADLQIGQVTGLRARP